MKSITFSGAGMLAGLAIMLDCHGHDVTDQDIARGMEAPYLLVHDQDGYRAGAMLYRPQWLNPYLRQFGLCMTEQSLSGQEVCRYLRTHAPAMLRVRLPKGGTHPVVFDGYSGERYSFVNIRTECSAEPERFAFTAATLKRHIEESVMVYTLEQCPVEKPDFIPLLLASLEHLAIYEQQLLAARQRTVTREAFEAMHTPLFRALMQEFQPLALLSGDWMLAEELRRLRHDYRHIFVDDDVKRVALDEHLPKKSIRKCIQWLREDVVDRIYALAGNDPDIEAKVEAFRQGRNE